MGVSVKEASKGCQRQCCDTISCCCCWDKLQVVLLATHTSHLLLVQSSGGHLEIRLPAGGGCLGHFAPQEPFFPTEQNIWIRGVNSRSSPLLVSFNLLFVILTSLLHPRPSMKIGVGLPQID